MKRIRYLFVMSLLAVLSIGFGVKAAEKNYVYHSNTKDLSVIYTEKVTAKENEIIDTVSSNNGETTRTALDPEYATQNWDFAVKEQFTKVSAARNGDMLTVQGRFKGKVIAKEFKIDDRPWFQAWNLSFGPFVLSGKARQEFWTIRNNDLKECIMVVLREKEETIKINGRMVETVKVKVTLNNWMSKFWSVYYWFRKSDGVFLRYEGANGPPGTPVTVMELVSEAN